MTPLIEDFKECAHQAGEVCNFLPGKLLREFGLKDFLENSLEDADDAPVIVVKALRFFCEDSSPQEEKFKFAVLTVGIFLSDTFKRKNVPTQPLRDLIAILRQGINEGQITNWIKSNF